MSHSIEQRPVDLVLLAPGAHLEGAPSREATWQGVALSTGDWAGLGDELARRSGQWSAADQVLMLLPGTQMSTTDVQVFFDTMRAQQLSLAQPSLAWASQFSDPVCLHNPAFVFRHTNRVDAHALGFSREALQACLPVMAAMPSAGAWGRLLPAGMPLPVAGAAVVDAAQVLREAPVTDDELTEPDWPASLLAEGAHRGPGYSWGGLGQRGQRVSLFDDSRETFVGLLASGLVCAVQEAEPIGELVLTHLLRSLEPAPTPPWVQDTDTEPAERAELPALRRSPILAPTC